jgi:hypothetical protein
MPLSSFLYVDDQDDAMAAHINRNTASALRAELGAALAITTQTALTDGDFPFLKLTPNANLDVLLPPEASTNHVHVIQNGSGTYTLTVKEDSDTMTIATVGPNTVAMFIPSVGTGWAAIKSIANPAASERITTVIDGMKLIWNSATSIGVGVGACYAENGDWIDVTSAITKASLSLSNSTWYHIYVYLSAGVASAEVVTTAPVAWKGSAYSKTGDTSRRYVGSVKTDGSGNVYGFQHELPANMMHYKNVASGSSPFRVLNAGTATTATAVACSGVVPVTSRIAALRHFNVGTQTAFTNESNSVSSTIYIAAATGFAVLQYVLHPIDASQQIWYLVVSGASYAVDVMGYQYDR